SQVKELYDAGISASRQRRDDLHAYGTGYDRAIAAASDRQRPADRDDRFANRGRRMRVYCARPETAALRAHQVDNAFRAISGRGTTRGTRAGAGTRTRHLSKRRADSARGADRSGGAAACDWIVTMNIEFPFQFDSRRRTAGADDDAHILQMIEQL